MYTLLLPNTTMVMSVTTWRHKQPLALSDGTSQKEPKDEDQDAFSRYSNDVHRMKALLNFSEDESVDDLDAINDALRGVGLSGLLGITLLCLSTNNVASARQV
jgi:hypothetical protein